MARIARHEQVAEEIGRIEPGEVVDALRRQQEIHLLDAVGDQHGDEIVAITQAHRHAHHDRIDVFQHRRMLQVTHVPQAIHLDEGRLQLLTYDAGVANVGTGKSHVGQSSMTHLFGMRRTADAAQLRIRQTIVLFQIIRDKQIVLGYDALDG